jgi:hypothetical protein
LDANLLKVHTEGSELEILKGAENTIRSRKPLFMYSVYHRREGFCGDIAEAMLLFPGYKWYFRQHGFQGSGAFVYAIPVDAKRSV